MGPAGRNGKREGPLPTAVLGKEAIRAHGPDLRCSRSAEQVQEVAAGLEAGLMRDGSTSRQMYAGRLASLVTRCGDLLGTGASCPRGVHAIFSHCPCRPPDPKAS